MRVCSRFTRRLTPHRHPHPTAASSLTLTSLRILPPSRGKEGTASRPLASAGLRQEENTAFAAGVCLGTTGLAGLPRFANVRAQEKHKRHPDRPCHDEHPAGRARSLPPDFSRLIATVWRSRRSRRPHGAGLIAPTSQPFHTRRVLERITELALLSSVIVVPDLIPDHASSRSCAISIDQLHIPSPRKPASKPASERAARPVSVMAAMLLLCCCYGRTIERRILTFKLAGYLPSSWMRNWDPQTFPCRM